MDALQSWYETPFGRQVLVAEREQVQNILSDKFGYYLLEFAASKQTFFADLSPIAHKYSMLMQSSIASDLSAFVVNGTDLPIEPESVDCIILPHVIEFCEHPKDLLAEVRTALRPNGYLLLLTFNAYSALGAYKFLKGGNQMPFNGKFYGYRALASMLESEEFHIDESAYCSFNIPSRGMQTKKQHNMWLALAQLAWPSSANVNIILARKQVGGVTPLRMDWTVKLSRKAERAGSIT